MKIPAVLLLEDGTVYHGHAGGAIGTATGEICFNTGMTGYQEIFTDPSYFGQILVATHVHVGNYGVRDYKLLEEEVQSSSIKISGLVCKSFNIFYSREQANHSIDDYFKKENKLRWEYNEPFSYIIALNNGKVMLKDEGKVTSYEANANKLFMELNNILVTCINGDIFQSKKFSFRFLETEKYNVAAMTPLDPAMKNFIDRIILYFDKNDFTVSKVEMMEPSENTTVIVFKNKKLNGDIPEKYFILN